jgi:hypothetical protein
MVSKYCFQRVKRIVPLRLGEVPGQQPSGAPQGDARAGARGRAEPPRARAVRPVDAVAHGGAAQLLRSAIDP